MPASGYYSLFSGAEVDSAVSIALNLGSGAIVSSGGSIILTADSGAYVDGGLTITGGSAVVDGKSVATQLITTSSTATTVSQSFAGGTSYIFTQPISSFEITALNSDTTEARVQFTLASGFTAFTTPASGGFCPVDFTPEASSYLMSVVGDNIVIAPYQDKSV